MDIITTAKQTNKQQQNLAPQTMIPQFIKPVNCFDLLENSQLKISKTKKICTLGPKSSNVQTLLKLMDNGMNVARLNFSHGTHESHEKYVDVIRQANKQHPSKSLAILLDTKGPEIRTGKNLDGKLITLVKGQQLELTTDYEFLGTNQKIACSYSQLISSVKEGSSILFSDGQVSSIVKRINLQTNTVFVQILNNGQLGQKKNMCLPGCEVKLPTINPYDQNDIVNFGLKHKVDFIAVSFARFRSDIEYIRKILAQKDEQYSKRVKIISKIQNRQALQNLDEVIDASDGIMVARGDLGMQTPLQKIVLLQKLITSKCLNAGKSVIVATQMVESMQTKPRPTRAQVSDITNAILDLADCTMTSGQTANGEFPFQTTSYMNKIAIETEKVCDYERILLTRKQEGKISHPEALKLVEHSFNKNVSIIFLRTDDLNLVNAISSYRPAAYIFVFSTSFEEMKRLTAINYGVYVFDADEYIKHDSLLQRIKEEFGFQKEFSILMAEMNGKFFSCHHKEIKLES